MGTDPFSDIGFNDEIGQATYVELIRIRRVITKTITTHPTLRTSANRSVNYDIMRDLFDPNRKLPDSELYTVLHLARAKNIDVREYAAYSRKGLGAIRLTAIDYDQPVMTQLSIVLVAHELDVPAEHDRILRYLNTHPEILPHRMVWPTLI